MANAITTNELAGSVWDVGVMIHRTNPVPLDNKSYFTTMADAQTYAQSGATAYVGQILTVLVNGSPKQYQIKNTTGELEPLGNTYATLSTANNVTTNGYVVPGAGTNANTNYYLNGTGGWSHVSTTDTTYATLSTASHATNTNYVINGPGTSTGSFLRGDGSWTTPANTTYGTFTNSSSGLVPQSATSNSNRFLKGDGSWSIPTDTTYSTFTASNNGLVPNPTNVNTNKFLKGDGTWDTPTDTRYSATGVLSMDGSNVFTHNQSTLAAGTYGATDNVSIGGGESGSIIVPQVVTDAYGHLTGLNARTLSITIPSGPDYTITTYTPPTYDTTHLSSQWAAAVASNAISVGNTYDAGINKNDNKTKYLADELISTEAAMSQAYVDGREADRYYGTCSAAATNSAKTVTISDYDTNTLTNGERFVICFTNGSTASSPTLQINSTTAYPLKYNGAAPATNLIQANSKLLIAYNSNEYHIVGGAGGSGSGSSTTEHDITVAGWVNQVGSGYYSNGNVIPAGSNLEDILTNLLSQITWPSPTVTYNWGLSGSTPSITPSVSNGSSVPVGTQITITESYSAPTVSRNSVISGMTNGFYTSTSGTRNSATSTTTTYTSTASGSYSLQMTYSGYNGHSSASSSDASLTVNNLYAVAGNNDTTAYSTSKTYSAPSISSLTLYPANSALQCDANHTVVASNANAVAAVSDWNTAKTRTANTTHRVVGYWPYYWAGYVNPPTLNTNTVNTVVNGMTDYLNIPPTTNGQIHLDANTKEFVIAVPNHGYTSITLVNSASAPFALSSSYFDFTRDVNPSGTTSNNFKNSNYRLFYMVAATGLSAANDFTLTFHT